MQDILSISAQEPPLEPPERPDTPEEERKAPADRLVVPADVISFTDDDEVVFVVGTRDGKVTKIAGLENMSNLKVSSSSFFHLILCYFVFHILLRNWYFEVVC